MIEVLEALAAAALALLLLWLGLSLPMVRAARRLRYVAPHCKSISPLEVPPSVRTQLAPGLAHLRALGFARPGALRLITLVASGQRQAQYALVLAHTRTPAVAYLVELSKADCARRYGIHFVSRSKAGQTLVTRNRAGIAGPLPVVKTLTQDCWLPTWAEVWRAHRHGMRDIERDPKRWQVQSVEGWIVAGAAAEAAAFDKRVGLGDLTPVAPAVYRYRWRCVVAMLVRGWAVFFKSMRAMADDTRVPTRISTSALAKPRKRARSSAPVEVPAEVPVSEPISLQPSLPPSVEPSVQASLQPSLQLTTQTAALEPNAPPAVAPPPVSASPPRQPGGRGRPAPSVSFFAALRARWRRQPQPPSAGAPGAPGVFGRRLLVALGVLAVVAVGGLLAVLLGEPDEPPASPAAQVAAAAAAPALTGRAAPRAEAGAPSGPSGPSAAYAASGASPPGASAASLSATDRSDPQALKAQLAQRNRWFETLQERLATYTNPNLRWALLETELSDPVIEEIANYLPGDLPAAEALLREAGDLAPRLPGAAAKQATVAIWLAALERQPAARLRQLQIALDLYERPDAAIEDPGPLLKATAQWLNESPADDVKARLARIDKSLAFAGARGPPAEVATLQAFKVDHTLARGDPAAALALARDYFERALRNGAMAQRVQQAQVLVDTMLAVEGPEAALLAADSALNAIESGSIPPGSATEGLRRHGLWLAQSAGREDWQQQQVQRLAVRGADPAAASWWTRAVAWLGSSRVPTPQTLDELERAHWQGDAVEARRVATEMLRQRPGYTVHLPEALGPQRALETPRLELLNAARRSVYERYGLPVRQDGGGLRPAPGPG